MRKFAAAGIAGLVCAVAAGAAFAQSTTWPALHVTPTVSPNVAGTVAKPQGVKLRVKISWQSLGEADQPIVTQFHIMFPKGSLYNGSKYPTCSVAVMNNKGPSGCTKASIMGSGGGVAYADTTLTRPQITVINGGARTVYFYTVLNNPARVQEPIAGRITKMSGKWAYELSVTVPQNLRIVAGVPIELTSLDVLAGAQNWLATTACDNGHWPFQITTTYENPNSAATGSSTETSSVACKG
jgi:hypothetical protein